MNLARVRLTVMAAIRSLFTLLEKIRLSLEVKVRSRSRRGAGRGTRGAGRK